MTAGHNALRGSGPGQVANTQFLHHPLAVNLGGLLDDTQIAGNLLVEAPRDDLHPYFALTWNEGRNFCLDRFLFRIKLTRAGVPCLSSRYRFEQAPLNTEDGSLIQIKGGHGHGHGHHGHRGGHGHHYGWGRGRGHHYGCTEAFTPLVQVTVTRRRL